MKARFAGPARRQAQGIDRWWRANHPDHLGSTSWVTDQNGRVHEHVEYFPYGEVWRDPRSDSDGAPVKGQRFLFTGKELDEETGLVYFGARYYEPTRARWSSADPALLRYLPNGKGESLPAGGVFTPANMNLYHYAGMNPVRLLDDTGLWTKEHWSETIDAAERNHVDPEVARAVAWGNVMIDHVPGLSFMPWGEPGLHFNLDMDQNGVGSLNRNANAYFNAAVEKAFQALESREKGMSHSCSGPGCYMDSAIMYKASKAAAEAFDLLGGAMHPMGDNDAHTPYQKQHGSGIWYHDQSAWPISTWGDGINRADNSSVDQKRIENTRRRYDATFQRFMQGLGPEQYRALEELYLGVGQAFDRPVN